MIHKSFKFHKCILQPNVFCGLQTQQTHVLADSHWNYFYSWNALFLPTQHVQQLSNKPGTTTGVVEEL